ncbi:MAG: glycosyltransferase family 4 protein [Gemmatimonadota bacterium]|nr:glycosyltransferase family 4 protein [Gemmatimonadota bacterium]MDZ4865564.1 glycosyltransferase family 4 protein [Gemmatimonadota bacterium]
MAEANQIGAGLLHGLRIAQLLESDGPGGAENVVVFLSRALQEAGAQVVAYVPRRGQGWLEQRLVGSGIEVEHFAIDRPFSPRFGRWLTDSFRDRRIDVAHSHEFTFAVYGAWAAWRRAIPHVITMHGGRYYAARWQRQLALGLAARMTAGMVAVSPALQAHLMHDLRLAPGRVRVVPNGIPDSSLPDPGIRKALGLPADARVVLAVGNLYPVKGHATLIGAMARLVTAHPTTHLLIAGRGELHEELVALANQLGVAPHVHLLGLRADIPALLAAADLFVMPSLSEGLPIAILEAMFSGTAIIASQVGAIGEALGDGSCGRLVPPGAVAELAAALADLLSNPAQAAALGEQARRRARDNYSTEKMVEHYTTIYGELLGRVSAS